MLMHVVTAIAFWRYHAFCGQVGTCAYMLCWLLLICQHRKYFFIINCFVITWFLLRLHVTQIALQFPFLFFFLLAQYFEQTAKCFSRNVLSSITEEACDQDRNYFFGQTEKSFRKNCCLSCSSMCHTLDEPWAFQKIMVEVSWHIQSRISRIHSKITVFARILCQQRDSNAQPLSS